MYEILLVNDDGLYSPGLRALFPVFSPAYNLTVVAPATQKSWIGKASSYHREMNCKNVTVDGINAFLFDGTPSDCAAAGIYHLCPRRPDLLISGINVGANIGDSYIISSGTVGGAVEGAIAGITSVSVGLEFEPETTKKIEFHPSEEDINKFEFTALYTKRLAQCLLGLTVPPEIKLFNLNLFENAGAGTPIEITRPARYNYGSFLEKKNGKFFHRGSSKDLSIADAGTDMAAIRDKKISLCFLDLMASNNKYHGFEENLVSLLQVER